MRIKRSSAIVVLMENDQFVFHSFLAQKSFLANSTALEIVRRLHAWTNLEALFGFLPGYTRESIVASIRELIGLGAVIVDDTDEADRDEEYAQAWLWGPLAGAYHFGSRGGDYLAEDVVGTILHELVKAVPSPPLFTKHPDSVRPIALPQGDAYPEPFLTMAARRTNRHLLDQPTPLRHLGDCLLFSMAITGIMKDPEVMDLPLKMTPSGGGRNPYEAYVCARNIEGLDPGTYHYSAYERSLAPVPGGPPPPFVDMLGGQRWAANGAAVIFLVANFDRPMWKYHDPAAYRVTAIEAGHIAQNIMLVATHYGLAANPSGAMAVKLIEQTLGVQALTQAVIYALVIGVPDTAPIASA